MRYPRFAWYVLGNVLYHVLCVPEVVVTVWARSYRQLWDALGSLESLPVSLDIQLH